MEKIFGISIVGIVVSIVLGVLGLLINPLLPLAGALFIVSCLVLIITFFIEAAIYLLR